MVGFILSDERRQSKAEGERDRSRSDGANVMAQFHFFCLFLFFHTLGDEVCGSNAYFIEFHTSSVTLAK